MKTSKHKSVVWTAAVLSLSPASFVLASHAAPVAPTSTGQTAANQAGSDIVDTAVAAGSFSTLVAAVKAAGLVDTLKKPGPYTVFAPTDAAFAKLPAGMVEGLLKPENKEQLKSILLFHVVASEVLAAKAMDLKSADTVNGQRVTIAAADGAVKVEEAHVTNTDIKCSNGVIHVIDTVLIPSSKNIVEIASDTGSFQTLLAAAKAAGLVEALQGKGPITVFAPTDEAFAKLGHDTIETLLKPENKQKLADILKYHVVAGRVYADSPQKGDGLTTLQGGMVKLSGGKSLMVEKSQILTADVDASNGVIHIIDTVLMPRTK